MRRKDREVSDFNKILAIMDKCDMCRLAMVDNGTPYIVPMNFGYSVRDSTVTLYFHSAGEGRKIDALKSIPTVCVEMDCEHKLVTGDKACDYTMNFESLIGNGSVEFIESEDEKVCAFTKIMQKYSDAGTFEFDEKLLKRTTLFKVVLSELVGKRHNT
jgi:nitroimidazol reductase NimA-like FMN-containing flavoprotein (pyridoxamine 5'-phosphate oxidase superfamily)